MGLPDSSESTTMSLIKIILTVAILGGVSSLLADGFDPAH